MQLKKIRSVVRLAWPVLLIAALLPTALAAQSLPADPVGPAVQLEQSRLLTPDPRTTAVNLILETLLAGDSEAVRAPVMFQAEALFLVGRYGEAADLFAVAAHQLQGTDFADDAHFCEIKALEAAGQDAVARERWQSWRLDHPDSPLALEADLAQAWNLLRSGDASGADLISGELAEGPVWPADDPRVLLLQAAVAYSSGQYDLALTHLALAGQTGPTTDVTLMLTGLCQLQRGQGFAGAMAFQELLDEHPHSALGGYALMAKASFFGDLENYRSAAAEFSRAARRTTRADHRAEAEYMAAACLFLGDDQTQGLADMHAVADTYAGDDLAARALFSLGEMRWLQGRYEQAIVRFNEVLSSYFAHELAGSALYRTGRCLDAMGRTTEANSTYQAVAEGHPYAPEAPAAVYLAGVGLFEQGRYMDAAPYFQLILDRYAGAGNVYVFESVDHQELVEASLCLLEYSYYQAGEMGLMAGAPHLALQKMPPSDSLWRAYTLLLDADALAAVDRFPESQTTLATLLTEFPDHSVGIRANRLLAWTYARQGRQDLAIETEETMLARFSAQDDQDNLGGALLTIANSHFNAKRYAEAAQRYQEYAQRFPGQGHKLMAIYQEGLCYVRLGRAGDAVDRWQTVTAEAPSSPEARKAWLRAGDILFQAGHYATARQSFISLMEFFPDDKARAAATLRLGRCDFNEGLGQAALARFQEVVANYPTAREAAEAAEGITHILYTLGREGEPGALAELVSTYPDSPLAPEAGFELARTVYEAGDYAAAAEAFDNLCGRYPRYSAADRNFYYAAESRELAGELDRAQVGWSNFLNHFPHSELAPAALFHQAGLRFNDGRYNLAVADFNTVLAMPAEDEIHAAALYNLAMSHRILGNSEDAQVALEDYRSRNSTDQARNVSVARTLGEIHQENGRWSEATRHFQAAVELGADAAEAVELNYLAGLCLKEAGQVQAALDAYALAIASSQKTNNFRLSALAHSADLYEQDGNFDGALTAYRDLIQNATDPTLVAAAKDRVVQLETALGH